MKQINSIPTKKSNPCVSFKEKNKGVRHEASLHPLSSHFFKLQRSLGNHGVQQLLQTSGKNHPNRLFRQNQDEEAVSDPQVQPVTTSTRTEWNNLPKIPEVKTAEIQDICNRLENNRNQIQNRFLQKQPQGGYMYTSTREALLGRSVLLADKKYRENHPDYIKGVTAAQNYQTWLANAKPSQYATGSNDPLKVAQWELWQDLKDEGNPSAMNTYDRPDVANISWGRGFAAIGGELQTMMNRLFIIDPQAKELFWEAGITIEGNQFVVVDTKEGYQAYGIAAQRLIENNVALISLFINIAQGSFVPDGEIHRQAVLDAQFEQFTKKGRAGDIPEFALQWDRQARALAGHNIHYGGRKFAPFQKNPWMLFAGIRGDLKSVIRRIAEVWGEKIQNTSDDSFYFVAEDPGVFENRLKNRAGGVALKHLAGPFDLRDSRLVPAPPPSDKNEPLILWTLSFYFESGKVYFRAKNRNEYYRLSE